jgi:hypothetical protein
VSINSADLAGFIEESFIAMNEICERVGMSEIEIFRLSENAMTYFLPEFTFERGQQIIAQSHRKDGTKRTPKNK